VSIQQCKTLFAIRYASAVILCFLFLFSGFNFIMKRIDVTFDDMQWILTQKDGQLGIATVYVKKFRSLSHYY